ncbi:major facilitator superfamily domain-containing protein [Cadophora sp. MPI-SDFR-AT-0126]|nr:major facilitator superfamily domain-containing protein [Leotiomycetes sp. MPI-SDFR-AT-0126]
MATDTKESKELDVITAPARAVAGDVENGESTSIYKGSNEEIAADTVAAASEYSSEQYRKLLWKIDLYLLPVMWICYGTQQADKTGISTQAIFGISKDTHLVGQQFSWLTTIFYLSYMVCEAPANYLMQKFPLGKFLSICMFFWGIIVLCIAFGKNWTDLMILRALQGALECTISPTFMLITGSWYTSREHTFRAVIWGTSNAGMNIISGLINYGIGTHAQNHPGGLAPWKGISFFLGSLTIVDSILVFLTLGTPSEVRWLNPDEKRAAAARIVSNQTGTDRQKKTEWKWDQAIDTFKDPQTWFFFFVQIVNALPNGGKTTFGKLIWVSFGFTNLETLVKGTVPEYLFSIVWFLIAGITTLKKPNLRFYFMFASLIPAFTGMMAIALLPNTGNLWLRWFLYQITTFGTLPGLLIWTFLPSNVAGRTKKSVTSALLFIAYCVGNAIGAQVFQAKDAPRYIPGLTVCGVMYGVEFTLMVCWRTYYVWQNKRRAKKIAEMGISPEESARIGAMNAEADITDFDNIHFKYQI